MTDLEEALLNARDDDTLLADLCREAAQKIASLRAAHEATKAELQALREALRKIDGIYHHSREDAAENAYMMQRIASEAIDDLRQALTRNDA